MRSPNFLDRLSESQIGATVKHLRVGDVENAMIEIPPVGEQKRIVEKVDLLMKLCDELEIRINHSIENGDRLVEAAIGSMTAA